ncbi:MAG: ABC-F family ATP-binding cassette domain-containing protein, partial [Bdellovibrionales bacterium]|nr:ABC-F family ATP-binding cassette domain-containing protein [Bdellovibrionales bacterium]
MAAPLISLQNIEKRYGATELFTKLSLQFEENARLGILGRNGAGKSTLLRIAAGLEDADEGSVLKRNDARVCYIAQEPTFSLSKTCVEIVSEAAQQTFPDIHEAQREALIA